MGSDDIHHCLPAFEIRGPVDLFKHNGGNEHIVDAGRNNVREEVVRNFLPLSGLVLKEKADYRCVEVDAKPVHGSNLPPAAGLALTAERNGITRSSPNRCYDLTYPSPKATRFFGRKCARKKSNLAQGLGHAVEQPLGQSVPLPPMYWLYLAAMMLGYAVLTQVVKTWFIRRFGD
jgi:hypothetical protein